MNVNQDKVNVLLVDDQLNNLVALEAILAEMGRDLELVRADSGRRALKQLLERDFAVILLDVRMPDMDGFETASLIRERERSRDTPIIFLTAFSFSETNVFRGYELGAVDYIFKPFHPDILRSKVNVFVHLFRQREAIKKQAHELARLSRQNELILNAAADGVVGVNLDGVATSANPAAARMLVRSVDQIISYDLHSLLHPNYPGVVTCEVESCRLSSAVRSNSSHDDVQETFFRLDGSSFPVAFRASPMRDGTGGTLGSVITFRDVTEQRAAAAAAEAERRYREAEAQNRAKDDFLATLSHELRTPLASILGWVQFLRIGGHSQEELEEALGTIETSGRLQARLIDDMLDVSRIILGKFQIELQPTHISDIVEAALTTVRPVAAKRDIKLASNLDEDTDALVEADNNRMQQVLGNILSNAIKFTPNGRCVDLQIERSDANVRISVIDQGEGIDPSFLPHVFERLQQSTSASNRGGLGLGLAIARYIVELHHGEIIAESEGRGKGARFTVTLPLLDAGGFTHEPNAQSSVTQ